MPLAVGSRRHGHSKGRAGAIPQAMSAETEPKTHSPATAAAHSPAEAPEPIAVLVSCAALGSSLRAFLRVRAANINTARNEARPGAFLETATISPGPRPPNPRRGPQNPGHREHSRLVTQAPPRAPYSRRSDRTHTSPPPPRPPATLEEAALRRGRPSSRLHGVYDGEF